MTVSVPVELPERLVIGVLALQGAFIEHIHYLQRLRPVGHTITAIPIRNPEELLQCHALIIPGGESTVIQSVASRTPGLLPALQSFVKNPQKAVWGTCAGMILMAEEDGIGGGKIIKGREGQKGWGGIKGMKVWRNLYGTQLESFEAQLDIPALSSPQTPFNAIFIRAPAIHSLASSSSSPSSSLPNTSPNSAEPSQSSPPEQNEMETETETICTLPDSLLPPPPPSDSPLGPPHLEDLGKIMVKQGKKLVTSFHPELSGDARIHEYWVEKCVLGRK